MLPQGTYHKRYIYLISTLAALGGLLFGSDLFRRDVWYIVLVGILIAVFSQADGQNSLFSYAPGPFGWLTSSPRPRFPS